MPTFTAIYIYPVKIHRRDTTHRMAEAQYVPENTPVSFADGFPILIIGQATLNDLNSRLEQALPMKTLATYL